MIISEKALVTEKEYHFKPTPHILTNYGLNRVIMSFIDKTSGIKFKYLFERFDIVFILANFALFSYMSNHELKVSTGYFQKERINNLHVYFRRDYNDRIVKPVIYQ